MSSDEDQPVVDDLVAGLRADRGLTVMIVRTGYDENRSKRLIAAARLSPWETLRLARRLKVNLSELPAFIGECMEEWGEIVNPTFGEVADCLKEITECLLDEGCRFRVTRGR